MEHISDEKIYKMHSYAEELTQSLWNLYLFDDDLKTEIDYEKNFSNIKLMLGKLNYEYATLICQRPELNKLEKPAEIKE